MAKDPSELAPREAINLLDGSTVKLVSLHGPLRKTPADAKASAKKAAEAAVTEYRRKATEIG